MFTRALRAIERRDRSISAVLGLVAIVIAVISLRLSEKANRAVERANEINEEVARISKTAWESKKAITLKAVISGNPPMLRLTPVSNDFVLQDSLVYYPCGGDHCPRLSGDRAAGVHDLSDAVASIEEVVKQRDSQRYVDPYGWISEQWLAEAYPILIRLRYVYEGETIEIHHLYVVIYKDPTSEVFHRDKGSAKPADQSVKLERVYFLERVPEDKASQDLDKQYRYWRRFVDMGRAYP